jgi:hypothetical protein
MYSEVLAVLKMPHSVRRHLGIELESYDQKIKPGSTSKNGQKKTPISLFSMSCKLSKTLDLIHTVCGVKDRAQY